MGRNTTQVKAPEQAPEQVTPEQAPEQVPAPESVSLGQVASAEKVRKGTRVFADVVGVQRVTLSDGRIGGVQKEQRADGTEGPMQVAILRPGADDGAGTRFALADLQRLSDALGAQGITLIAPYKAPEQAPAA